MLSRAEALAAELESRSAFEYVRLETIAYAWAMLLDAAKAPIWANSEVERQQWKGTFNEARWRPVEARPAVTLDNPPPGH